MLRLSETVGSLVNNKLEECQNNDSFPTQAVNPDQKWYEFTLVVEDFSQL
jgi:hypothetical protein